MRPSFLSSLLGFACALAACGGGVDSSPGGQGGDGGTDAGCTTATLGANRACVPGTGAANAPITLAYDAPGCVACFSTIDPCKVTVTSDRVEITVTTTTCPPAGGGDCPASCLLPAGTCTLPPLPEGSFTVELVGEGAHSGFGPRRLVVAADGKETSCTLPPSGLAPEPLDLSGYPRACASDGDCVIARSGNLCQPCACPNDALAKTAEAGYQSEFRARSSQCPASNDGVVCAACPPMKAVCEVAVGQPSGTCKLVSGF